MMSLMLHIPSNQANTFMYASAAVPRIDEPTAIPTLTRDTRWVLFLLTLKGFGFVFCSMTDPFPSRKILKAVSPLGAWAKRLGFLDLVGTRLL